MRVEFVNIFEDLRYPGKYIEETIFGGLGIRLPRYCFPLDTIEDSCLAQSYSRYDLDL